MYKSIYLCWGFLACGFNLAHGCSLSNLWRFLSPKLCHPHSPHPTQTAAEKSPSWYLWCLIRDNRRDFLKCNFWHPNWDNKWCAKLSHYFSLGLDDPRKHAHNYIWIVGGSSESSHLKTKSTPLPVQFEIKFKGAHPPTQTFENFFLLKNPLFCSHQRHIQ